MRIPIAVKLFLGFLVIVFLNLFYTVIVFKFSDLNTIAHILKKQDWAQQGFLRVTALHNNRKRSQAVFSKLRKEESVQNLRETSNAISGLLDSLVSQLDTVRVLDSAIATEATYNQKLVSLIDFLPSVVTYNRQYVQGTENLALAFAAAPTKAQENERDILQAKYRIDAADSNLTLALRSAMGMIDEQTKERIKEIENRTNNAKHVTLFIVIGVSIFAAGFAFVFSNAITRRLRKLKDSANYIGKGNFYFDPLGFSKDEIGDVAVAFFDMALDLKKTQEELVKSKRLAAIGEVVASVNHEINNPLMIISGNAQFLEMSMQDFPDDIKERIRTILSETDRISQVTRKLREIKNPVVEDYTSSGEQMINLDKSSREAV